jgi:hypothetical protein
MQTAPPTVNELFECFLLQETGKYLANTTPIIDISRRKIDSECTLSSRGEHYRVNPVQRQQVTVSLIADLPESR